MANLLSRTQSPTPFPAFDPDQRARFDERARFVVQAPWSALQRVHEELVQLHGSELEELDEAPSVASAQALLAQLDAARRDGLTDATEGAVGGVSGVRWLLFRPGRSLSTGEAEIASRGFYDVADRPPLSLWVEAVGRPRAEGSQETEVAILCAVPEAVCDAAAAGRDVCSSGALAWVEELAPPLAEQLGDVS